MAIIIRQRIIVALPEGQRLVPLAQWDGEPGVLLGPADDPAVLAGRLDGIAVIAIDFPQFTDGRGYSIARLLRERHGYKGELRAVGEVLRDNLFYLSRCGFDSFALSDSTQLEAALEGLSDFSEGYQASVERPQPLFRRRAA
jgi:uncharacterized protein (DUF934 family)